MREIVEPVIAGMAAEGHPFRGFLYVGLMLTPDGPKVIEFNVRLGDPEAQVILPLIDEPLLPLLVAGASGALRSRTALRAGRDRLVGVVLASRGYPESSESGQPITGIEAAERLPGVSVYHAGTAARDGRTRHGRRPRAHRRRPRRPTSRTPSPAPTPASRRSPSTACSTGGISDARLFKSPIASQFAKSSPIEVFRRHLRLPREPGRLARLRGGASRRAARCRRRLTKPTSSSSTPAR